MQLYIKSSLLTNSENSYEYTLSSLCYRGASKYDQAYAQCDYSSFGDKKKNMPTNMGWVLSLQTKEEVDLTQDWGKKKVS